MLFQASTVGALLDGAFDGDLSFAELAEHGDLGLGTLNRLDGEMIALDGELLPRRRRRRRSTRCRAEAKTPFAVVTRFEPDDRRAASRSRLAHEQLLARLDAAGPGRRLLLRDPPRRPLRAGPGPLGPAPRRRPTGRWPRSSPTSTSSSCADVAGTMLGFRFPAYAEGIEVGGYHLHFISDDRSRGGHVLDSRAAGGLRVRLDPSNDLHVELPPAGRPRRPRPGRRHPRGDRPGRGRLGR